MSINWFCCTGEPSVPLVMVGQFDIKIIATSSNKKS